MTFSNNTITILNVGLFWIPGIVWLCGVVLLRTALPCIKLFVFLHVYSGVKFVTLTLNCCLLWLSERSLLVKFRSWPDISNGPFN